MTDSLTIVRIASDAEDIDVLHVELTSASEIAFTVNHKGLDYNTVLMDICHVAPHMIRLDADLMEAYDNAFRTQPDVEDRRAVGVFLHKYAGRVPVSLREMFR